MKNVLCKAVMKKGGWIEGFYMCSVDGETHFIANYPNANMSMPALDIIYPESLCLFSGYFDKYGRKIFDNDCVKIKNKVYKVVFESAAFMLEKINKDSEPYMYFLCDMPESSIEILGNVYDTLSRRKIIRTRFFRPAFRHYFGKSLANTTVLASFLPHIDKKQLEKNSANLKPLKFGIFRGGRVREYFRILNPTTKKKPNLSGLRRVRIILRRLTKKHCVLPYTGDHTGSPLQKTFPDSHSVGNGS